MTTCSTCNDTHRMSLGESVVPCTYCPRPCGDCGAANDAYCHRTPCSCVCHRQPQRVYVAFGCGLQVWSRTEAHAAIRSIIEAMKAEDGGLEVAERAALAAREKRR